MLHLDGKASFVIDLNPTTATLDVIGDFVNGGHTEIGKLPPGSYNMTATYNGDEIYPPAVTGAELLISSTCLLMTVVLS